MEKLSDAIKAYIEFKIDSSKSGNFIRSREEIQNQREQERLLKNEIDIVVGKILGGRVDVLREQENEGCGDAKAPGGKTI